MEWFEWVEVQISLDHSWSVISLLHVGWKHINIAHNRRYSFWKKVSDTVRRAESFMLNTYRYRFSQSHDIWLSIFALIDVLHAKFPRIRKLG